MSAQNGKLTSPPAEATGSAPVAEVEGVWKRFGSTQALRDVSLQLRAGRCLGLVGRNGAGKSTLVSILSGLERPDRGEVRFGGQAAPGLSDRAGWRERVATVYQRSMVVPSLTVAENVFLGQPPRRPGGAVDWGAMRAQTRQIVAEWGFEIDADERGEAISAEQRQLVEIARALVRGTRCMVLDEPTAALEHSAIERLFERVRQLVAGGVAVLYISHHLEEVFEICDDVVVLRDGEQVLTTSSRAITQSELVRAMVGGVEPSAAARTHAAAARALGASGPSTPRLRVQDLWANATGGALRGVSFELAAGERAGVTGLRGSGAFLLGRVLAGASPFSRGTVELDGRPLPSGRPDQALALGVGYIPEDRSIEGFVPMMGAAENMTLTVSDRLAGRFGFLRPARRHAAASPVAERLALVSAGLDQPVAQLSGGNQQKVTVGRALMHDPSLIVAIAPTRGVDVASKARLLDSLARAVRDTGAALLLITDEIDDLEICDRVMVVVRGRLEREFDTPPWIREELITASEGLFTEERA